MIVEISGIDLLKLVNGESVTIGDAILREGPESRISGMSEPRPAPRKYGGGGNNRRSAKVTTGHFFMRALFDGICYEDGCDKALRKGKWIVRDADRKKVYCTGHGVAHFPDLKDSTDYQEAMAV
jgi:hypothetical protein